MLHLSEGLLDLRQQPPEGAHHTIGAVLVAEGKLDPNATVAKDVPERKDSVFGDATLRQVLDMRTGLKCSDS